MVSERKPKISEMQRRREEYIRGETVWEKEGRPRSRKLED